MSEAGDYDPGPWKGHNFQSAYQAFDATAGRSYANAKAAGKTLHDLLPESITTDVAYPLVIETDQTGSMGEWTKTIFSKLPYLDKEREYYLGKDSAIAFGAIGDAHKGERYANQLRPFETGLELKKIIENELMIEELGGGNGGETYELGALYLARNVHMPNAIKPICIFIGDEAPFDSITPDLARDYARVELEKAISTKDVFAELRRKFAVYHILKPYGSSGMNSDQLDHDSKANMMRWAKLVGGDHIAILNDPMRVVDVIFGILAVEMGKVDLFKKEIEGRQTQKQVDTVYKSLATIHNLQGGEQKLLNAGKSTLHRPIDGETSEPLI